MQSIQKLCADNLRTFIDTNYGIELKSTHAHELVAAFFGYKSKAALDTDTITHVNNLSQAEFIVMMPDNFIDERRKKLSGLSQELPDSYTMGEAVYTPLFSDQWWKSSYPPFRSFEKLAKFIVENNDSFQHAFKFYENLPMHYILDVQTEENDMVLTIWHCHEISTEELITDGRSIIKLSRVAGHIGYGKPQIAVEKLTGHFRQILKKDKKYPIVLDG